VKFYCVTSSVRKSSASTSRLATRGGRFRDGEESFETDAATEKMLLKAIAQCERGQTVPVEQVLSELRSRE
jgi:hypothetical protein